MLTFLRKIRKSLIESDSTHNPVSPASRYLLYALGEIALVVIGILIALQINNWNEEKKDRLKEKEVLQDILTNLERNNALIQESLLLVEGFDRSSDIVLAALRNKSPYSDSLTKHFFPLVERVAYSSLLVRRVMNR